ncbi:MAG: hypothetical protein CSA50_02835 [Gammaproteobacteria bacterium]|nr:MAG: hypothetical protein CSA50_02835 [Gammaproteobacteria bacterium]
MSQTILIVNNDPSFLKKAKELTRKNAFDIDIVSATDRFSALNMLKGDIPLGYSPIEFLFTTLAIPRVADGYLLIAKAAKKLLPSKNIFVFVNELTDQVLYSVRLQGVERIHQITEFDSILRQIGGTSVRAPVSEERPIVGGNDVQKIQAVLNEVMGPVGSFIFDKCFDSEKHLDDTSSLIDSIIREIGDNEQVRQFQELLRSR